MFLFKSFLMFMDVFLACVSIQHMSAWCSQRPEGVRSCRSGLTVGCEQPYKCSKSNAGPLFFLKCLKFYFYFFFLNQVFTFCIHFTFQPQFSSFPSPHQKNEEKVQDLHNGLLINCKNNDIMVLLLEQQVVLIVEKSLYSQIFHF